MLVRSSHSPAVGCHTTSLLMPSLRQHSASAPHSQNLQAGRSPAAPQLEGSSQLWPSVEKETAALHGEQMEGHSTGGTPLWAREWLWWLEPNLVPAEAALLYLQYLSAYWHTHAILPFISVSARKYQGLWPIQELWIFHRKKLLLCVHARTRFTFCVSFLSLWCSEKGSNLAGLKTKNFISPDEQLLRYQEPMARLLCSTWCPWITPGDSLLIYGSRNSQQMHREQGKRARKLRVINTARSTQRQVSEKEESLTDARHWKRTGWYKQVVQNSSLWRDCVPESLLSRASR